MKKICLLGTGLIGTHYTMSLHDHRGKDRIHKVYSRTEERARDFAKHFDIPQWTTDLDEAITDPEIDVIIIGLPNFLHKDIIFKAADAGKSILCTKPLGVSGKDAKEMLDKVEKAGVFHGYLEDLTYTPKTLKSLESVKHGALGRIMWIRSREAHSGPHSDWFWNPQQSGGGAIVDLACHCIEIARNFIGKDIKPVEVMCWADTLVKNIDAEDNALGIVRYENGAIGQFEVSWAYRGGLDLRDEVSGTEGSIRIDHFLRTGLEMFTTVGEKGYLAEKAESDTGWLFPVGDEVNELGYMHMFTDMFNALEQGKQPMETFYDGYIVNAVMDACYESVKSKKWEPVKLDVWRGKEGVKSIKENKEYDKDHYLVKDELMPDGRKKVILKHKETGEISQKVVENV